MFPFTSGTLPSGWLLCDGSAVSTTTYAALYAVIGNTFGSNPPAGQFLLPDTRSRVLMARGQGTGLSNRARGTSLGAETSTTNAGVGTQPAYQLPAHTHGTGTLSITASGGLHTHADSAAHSHSHTDPGHHHSMYICGEAGAPGSEPGADGAGTSSFTSTGPLTANAGITVNTGHAALSSTTHTHPSSDFSGSFGYSGTGSVSGDSGELSRSACRCILLISDVPAASSTTLSTTCALSNGAFATVPPALVATFMIKF